jgi:curved DNA-binding protein
MEYKDYYKILGVPRSADADAIKRAYRKLARKYHPDVSKEKNAEERFKDVQEAYEVLRDAQKRAAYDQFGESVAAGAGPRRPPPGYAQGFDFGFDFTPGAGPGPGGPGPRSGFSDFFDALFGAGAARGFRGPDFEEVGAGPAGGRRRPGTPERAHARVEITLEEAYRGTTRTLEMTEPQADGTVRRRSIEVRIPPGARPGRRIRVRGQGADAPGGRGDLLLEVDVAAHPRFTLDGADVHLELPVAPWEAALGARINVPTLGGTVALTVRPGSQSGERLRLRGRGLPGKAPGDQYVTLRIVNPPADTPAAREIYERMARELAFDPRAGW